MDMLKALQSERRTLSQLAEALEVDKAAVHRHLRKLEDGGLVKRTEEHGFIYYALTWKARDLVSPGENTRVVVLLSTSLLLALMLSIVLSVAMAGVPEMGEGLSPIDSNESQIFEERAQEVQETLYLVAGLMAALSIATAFMALGILHRPRQPGAELVEERGSAVSEEENPGLGD
ncbi:MAG: winged helix-turn-helix transcriptional regulator [Methanomassiliicoccales archaeon]|nr:winged helix-turn-helix transcriptional regulator [Methanomassiliicoccales archaeon]